MSFSKKTYLMVGVAILGLAFTATQANAQTPVDVSIETDSSITVVDGDDMDFGTWFLVFRNADPFELRMATNGVITPQNMAGGAGDSLAAELVNIDQEANMTVELPTGANNIQLNMTRTAITDFPSAALTLQAITYGTATQGANQAMAFPGASPVTVVTGGTPEVVSFGADIAVTATPADAAHTATFDVNFNF
jgi:hypothetical protein